MGLSQARCCELVGAEIARLAAITDGVDPAMPVPTCGDWTIADLLEHTGTVYRWGATMVRDSAQERLARDEVDWGLPADPAEYPAWFGAAADFAVEQFRRCDPATPMWAWGWPKTAGFWPRRMVHEVGVHRADAELALGIDVEMDPEVAADGIEELLDNLPQAAYFAPNVEQLRGNGESIGLHAPDLGAQWQIHLLPDRFAWVRHDTYAADRADCEVVARAPARCLLLGLYGRPACIELDGDEDLFDRWIANSAI
jgi:uncharacterized protein (TIGR03083 family)